MYGLFKVMMNWKLLPWLFFEGYIYGLLRGLTECTMYISKDIFMVSYVGL